MTSIHKLENGLPDPVLADIASLKAALARYQNAADTAQIHLQRQALEMATLNTRCGGLEQENALLQKEIAFLRSNPETSTSSSSASLQISEMTLALRRLSDQLNSSEDALQDQAEQIARAHSARSQAKHEVEAAHKMVTRIRVREEQALDRVRELEFDLKKKEEERKMADLVVREYADLVRTIEGRGSLSSTSALASHPIPSGEKSDINSSVNGDIKSGGGHRHQSSDPPTGPTVNGNSAPPSSSNTRTKPIDSLHEGRAGLQRLLSEFHEQTEQLEEEIAKLHGEREVLEMKLAVCEQVAADEHRELADVKAELANALRADKSAAKMVERYMSFSQQSTNLLQAALQTQKKRHAATVATLESQLSSASSMAEREKGISERLRCTLDEMTIEISRESFGRRRETSLRLSIAERERKIGQMLEKWVNNMEQRSGDSGEDAKDGNHLRHISTAKQILNALHASSHEVSATPDGDRRIQMALAAVQELSNELEGETSKRMLLQRENADLKRAHVELKFTMAENPSGSESDETKEVEEGSNVDALSNADSISSPPEAQTLDPTSQPANDTTKRSTEDASASLEFHAPRGGADSAPQPSNDTQLLSPDHPAEPSSSSRLQTQPDAHESERIVALRGVAKRYDNLQAAFNDCHDALVALQSSLKREEENAAESYLVVAVERLHDYCEDARVELEILVADEARISQGYETLLGISSGTHTPVPASSGSANEVLVEELLEEKVDAFVKGTLPSMGKARSLFEGKLDNLMHDIAIVKRAMHEEMNSPMDEGLSTDKSPEAQPSTTNDINFPSQGFNREGGKMDIDGPIDQLTWKTLASSLSANLPSPDSRPVQSFGSLMASGRPRQPSSSDKSKLRSRTTASGSNPLNHLGLRIAMPRGTTSQGQGLSTSFNIHSPFPFALRPLDSAGSEGLPNSAPISRATSGWFTPSGISRASTISNIHAVGFGMGMTMSPRNPPDRTRSSTSVAHLEMATATGKEGVDASSRGGQDEVE